MILSDDAIRQLFKLQNEMDKMKTYGDRDINYDIIRITLKNGNAISYDVPEWDDYSYDGKFFAIRKNGTCIAYYNCDDVFSVELIRSGDDEEDI